MFSHSLRVWERGKDSKNDEQIHRNRELPKASEAILITSTMRLRKLCILATSGLLSFSGVSEATTQNLSTQGTYAIWDTFGSGTTYINVAPDASASGLSLGLFLQSTPEGVDFGGHDDFFDHGTGKASWYISGRADFAVTKLTLQIKMGTGDQNYFWPVLIVNTAFISPGASGVVETEEVIGGQNMFIRTWSWDINLPANTIFGFDFQTSAGQNVVLDAVAINAIPEPATWASIAMGLGLLVGCSGLRRRSK